MRRSVRPSQAPCAFLLAAAISALLLTAPSRAQEAASGARYPNVVLLAVDTLRLDRLSAYGYHRDTSPELDALMARGARLTEARCVEGLTGPSMVSTVTSLYPHDHGASRNGLRMRAGLPSLPKILSRRGFRTAAFVSNWTLKDKLTGLAEHFDHFEEVLTRTRWFGMVDSEATGEDETEAVISWLEEHKESQGNRPFFVWAHYVEPHAPYVLQEDFVERLQIMGKADRSDRYDTEVAYVDRAAGRLLDAVERLSPDRPTLVVFQSDHGESLGEHGYWGHGRNLWSPVMHIPMAFVWPGKIPAGTFDGLASNVDIPPTVLGLLGLPIPPAFRGEDLSAALLGRESPDPERIVYLQAHKGAVLGGADLERARRRGLLEVGLVRKDADGPGYAKETYRLRGEDRSLYALSADPRELKSLVDESSERSAELEAWYQEVMAGLKAADELPPPSLDEESVEKLKALGYLD